MNTGMTDAVREALQAAARLDFWVMADQGTEGTHRDDDLRKGASVLRRLATLAAPPQGREVVADVWQCVPKEANREQILAACKAYDATEEADGMQYNSMKAGYAAALAAAPPPPAIGEEEIARALMAVSTPRGDNVWNEGLHILCRADAAKIMARAVLELLNGHQDHG